ncbi:DegT/DnrJ/EryC1/StrS family aminotransferase, partial [Rhizobium leguminosarum]|uniref:DegT/DnrJ/EryC1/StrS family aminotransferase n=1 Tax=Rhizobium leguminosarum TaxID=384 RepID=UPI003F94C64E
LDIGLGADEHAIADFKRFRMFETGAARNLQSRAAAPRDRLPNGFPHQCVDDTVACGEGGMVVTNDDDQAKTMRMLRDWG